MIKIKLAKTTSDYQQIETLADIIWRAHYIPIEGEAQINYMLNKYQTAKAIEKQVEDGYEYFTLFYDKTPVGYIAIKPEGDVLFLSKIYVLSSFRGKKIGKTAMQFIENKAKTYQLKSIRLTVNKDNTIAINAYEKLGFLNGGSKVTDIGNGFIMDDYEMIKQIPA